MEDELGKQVAGQTEAIQFFQQSAGNSHSDNRGCDNGNIPASTSIVGSRNWLGDDRSLINNRWSGSRFGLLVMVLPWKGKTGNQENSLAEISFNYVIILDIECDEKCGGVRIRWLQ